MSVSKLGAGDHKHFKIIVDIVQLPFSERTEVLGRMPSHIRRHQKRLLQCLAFLTQTSGDIDRGTNHCEIEPVRDSDVAVHQIAEMESDGALQS